MKHERSAGAYVFTKAAGGIRLLVLKRIDGEGYDLPKGHLEKGETDEQAAKREILEESGLRAEFIPHFRDVSEYEFYRRGEAVGKTVVYFMSFASKPKVRVSKEHASYIWCDLKEALRHINYENMVGHLRNAFDYAKRWDAMNELNREYARLPSKFKGWDLSRRFVPGDGPLNAKIMVIGQAPGANEDVQLHPFVGRSGQLLTRVLTKAGIDRGKVYITSVVQFFPPKNRIPSAEEIEQCKEFFSRQMGIVKPKVVVLLGNVAGKEVLGQAEVKKNHGKTVLRNGVRYFLTFHPAAALRFPPLERPMVEDLETLAKQMSE